MTRLQVVLMMRIELDAYKINVESRIDSDGDVYWAASFQDIPQCVGGGNTKEEAIKDAYDNLSFYLKTLAKK